MLHPPQDRELTMKLIEICVNCPDAESARRISELLLEECLIACSNIHASIESSYHWKGNVERETEVPLILKTREELFDLVAQKIKTLHPYETPSIIGIEVDQVDQDYLDWIYAETSSVPDE